MAEEHGQVVEDDELDAEREARRRIALAQIRQYPDSVLRMKALEVEAFDDDLRRLADRMKLLMADANGIGLAATQVGVLRRLFVFQAGEDEEPRAVANPRFAAVSDEVESDDEGCLSLQGVLVPVERHVQVTLEGQDEQGAPVALDLAGRWARVAQHEVDHLDGVLMLDRTTPEARREALGKLRQQPTLVIR